MVRCEQELALKHAFVNNHDWQFRVSRHRAFWRARKDHPSAEQIYQKVKKTHSTISLATVYITLDLLKKLSLVQELGFSDRSSRYDPNNSPHVNVICPKCGKIYDYESADVKKMLSQVVAEAGLTPLRQRLDLYAICDKCSQKKKQN